MKLTKKENEYYILRIAHLKQEISGIEWLLYIGNPTNRELITWYNTHSDPTWTYPNEAAYNILMNIELELLYRGVK
jgi:hypothetical protein